jgi:hypothetical protein
MPNDRLPSGVMYHVIPDKDDTRTMSQKLADLCQQFRRKTGQWPSTVLARPDTLGDFESPSGLEVKTDKRIPRSHFLVGPLKTEVN